MILLQAQFIYRIFLAIFTIVFILMSYGCFSVKPIYFDDDKKVAQKQVEKFHRLFNDENYSEIYDLFTPKVKNAQSKEQFISALQNFRAKTGRVKSSKLIKSNVKQQASFRLINMSYETDFEREKLLEEFDCLVSDETAIFDFYAEPEKIPDNH